MVLVQLPISGSVQKLVSGGTESLAGQLIPVEPVDLGINVPAFGALLGLSVTWDYVAGENVSALLAGSLGIQLLSMGPTPIIMWANSVPNYTAQSFPGFFFPVWEIVVNSNPTDAATLAGGGTLASATESFFNGYAGGIFKTDASGFISGKVSYNLTVPLPYARQLRVNAVNANVSPGGAIVAQLAVRYQVAAVVEA